MLAESDFYEGQYVVYPARGVGTITGFEEQEVAGEAVRFILISFSKDKMTIRLPLNKSITKKIRGLCSREEMHEAVECLKAPSKAKKMMWSRRAQEYEAKINSGDPISIAQVVRDLHRKSNQPDHSYSERQLYQEALERLTREYAIVQEVDETLALQELECVLEAA